MLEEAVYQEAGDVAWAIWLSACARLAAGVVQEDWND